MKLIYYFFVLLIFVMVCCSPSNNQIDSNVIRTERPYEEVEFFWTNLSDLCGNKYKGKLTKRNHDDVTFTGKELYLDVIKCNKDSVFLAFHVGDDHSRILVLSIKGRGLNLKHIHTQENGEEEVRSNYGGYTINKGLAEIQYFPADQETSIMSANAAGNIWWIELKDNEKLVYNLVRVGTDRKMQVEFDLTNNLDISLPKPWGWSH